MRRGILLAVALRSSASTLTEICGVGVLVAARLLGEVGDIGRFRSPNQFAALNGTAPIPASSGRVQRHRLNRGGNRRLNRAIHTVALIQARVDPRAHAYLERRRSEGKTRREALRALKPSSLQRDLSPVEVRLSASGDRCLPV